MYMNVHLYSNTIADNTGAHAGYGVKHLGLNTYRTARNFYVFFLVGMESGMRHNYILVLPISTGYEVRAYSFHHWYLTSSSAQMLNMRLYREYKYQKLAFALSRIRDSGPVMDCKASLSTN